MEGKNNKRGCLSTFRGIFTRHHAPSPIAASRPSVDMPLLSSEAVQEDNRPRGNVSNAHNRQNPTLHRSSEGWFLPELAQPSTNLLESNRTMPIVSQPGLERASSILLGLQHILPQAAPEYAGEDAQRTPHTILSAHSNSQHAHDPIPLQLPATLRNPAPQTSPVFDTSAPLADALRSPGVGANPPSSLPHGFHENGPRNSYFQNAGYNNFLQSGEGKITFGDQFYERSPAVSVNGKV